MLNVTNDLGGVELTVWRNPITYTFPRLPSVAVSEALNSLVEIWLAISIRTLEEHHPSEAVLPRVPSACLSHCPNSANALDLLLPRKNLGLPIPEPCGARSKQATAAAPPFAAN